MDLSLEVYRKIIKCVGHRADIAALCRVSKQFQYVGERVLYNTLLLRDPHLAISLCETLATQTRVAMLVDALTVQTSDEDSDEEDEEEEGDERPNRPAAGDSLPEGFWPSIARALEKTTQLRYLNIHINGSEDRAVAWILHNCTFRLKRFHCDLDWDRHLVAFLNKQINLDDLYIMDFKEPGSNFCTDMTVDADATKLPLQLDAGALPNLATLECTFSEAAMAIVPGRPITCLKTCFSRSDPRDKRAEMLVLLSKINRSTRPLRSLDIADSAYNQTFSLELLGHIVRTTTNMSQLRYLGTLVLPSSGKERLEFYGLLMRLPRVQCIEVEVSEWAPPPTTPPAFRALTNEIRLYSPNIMRVIFVDDFERTAVTVSAGVCKIDRDANFEFLWRDL